MTGLLIKTVFAAAIAAAGLASAVEAQAASRFMQVGAVTSQPIGHYEFCQTHRDECSIKTANTVAPKVTDYGWSVVREINSEVNRTITPMTDLELYGRDEVWAYPTDAGDCEDFALLKRKLLLQRGFSPADLLMTVVRKPDGEGHAVLTLRTSDGDFVLDNLEADIKLWSDTHYRFLKRQASFDTGRWVSIDNSDEVLVGSVAQ
jgi:predicted transglutaminase-like cysteine proteinase